MRECIDIKLAIVLGIVMLMSTQLVPSWAQLPLPGDCWKDIGKCQSEAATEEEFREDCCPVLEAAVGNATMCLCSVLPVLEMDPKINDIVSQLLSICDADLSLDSICAGSAPSPAGTKSAPAPVPSLPCWDDVDMCINDNRERIDTMPEFNASSPQYNETEFLCCPHVKEIAKTEKPCFCGITTVMELQPSMTPAIMQVVARCHVADSVLSLKDYCQGVVAPSLAPGPMIQGEGPTAALGPTADSQLGAANKIMTAGSISSLLVFLTYLLF